MYFHWSFDNFITFDHFSPTQILPHPFFLPYPTNYVSFILNASLNDAAQIFLDFYGPLPRNIFLQKTDSQPPIYYQLPITPFILERIHAQLSI